MSDLIFSLMIKNKEKTHDDIIAYIEGLRMQGGYSFEQISRNDKIDINDYSDMVDGQKSPDLMMLIKLWDALGVDPVCIYKKPR